MRLDSKARKILAIVAVCSLIIASFYLGHTLGSNGSSNKDFTLSSGIYPSGVSYTIYKEGSTYYAKNAYGAIDYSGTSASTVFQSCINALGYYGGTIAVCEGDYYFSEPVKINKNYVRIVSAGSVVTPRIKANTNNIPLFVVNENAGTYVSNFVIEGMYLEGKTDATSSQILVNAAWTYEFHMKDCNLAFGYIGVYIKEFTRAWIENTVFWKSDNTQIKIDGGTGSALDYIYITNCYVDGGIYGIYIKGIDAYKIEHTSVVASTTGIYIERGSNRDTIGVIADTDIDNCVTGLYFYNARTVQVSNLWSVGNDYGVKIERSDSIHISHGWIGGNDKDGIYVADSTRCVFDGLRIYDNNLGGSYSGLYLYNTNNTIITDCQFWDYPSLSQHQAYGIREAGTSDYNIITNCNVKDCATANILKVGGSTHVNLCWNGTIWIP